MKKIFLIITLFLLLASSFLVYKYFNQNEEDKKIIINNIKTSKNEVENIYVDKNPIKLGLYKYYGRGKERELIKIYETNWTYHNDISSFEVFYTNDEYINSNYFQDTFKEYYDNYTNIDNYKIGYKISFLTQDAEINKTILKPSDALEFANYLEIYLYDDYNREKGVWYSHTNDKDMNDETLLTSIKLTAGKNIESITSDITVTAFTYNSNDFDEFGNYRGNSKYSIVIKKSLA